MLELLGHRLGRCSRRSLLQVGALGATGLSLPWLLRARAAQAAEGETPKQTAVILIFLRGGPSHLDMYDLKPGAPAEFRGEFIPVSTNVSGCEISEHLPYEARVMDKIAIVRSACHTNAGHGMGAQFMMTGRLPTIEINDNIFPSVGSITAALRGANRPGLPAYVGLPNDADFGKAAYLGAAYNPFSPGDDPNNDSFQVRNLKLPGAIDETRLGDRRALLSDIDTLRRDVDAQGTAAGLDEFYRDAFEMVTSKQALAAFDIQQETSEMRHRYGRHSWGQCCLLARRLVEAGVTFVTLNLGGWDTHGDNFNALKTRLLPPYDQGVAALIGDLAERGLHERVLIMVHGEFGRTPRINSGVGRDHWPQAMSVLFSGGGLRMGQMIGATDARAEYPSTQPYLPGDLFATMYHVLGIDHHHVFYDQARRPMAVLPQGEPIPELVG